MISKNYEVEFLAKIVNKLYSVETETDKGEDRQSIATKVKAAVAWCEQASPVTPPDNYGLSKMWEYLLFIKWDILRITGDQVLIPYFLSVRGFTIKSLHKQSINCF